MKYEHLEDIINLADKFDLLATTTLIKYWNYRDIGLKHYTAMQKIEMDYKEVQNGYMSKVR